MKITAPPIEWCNILFQLLIKYFSKILSDSKLKFFRLTKMFKIKSLQTKAQYFIRGSDKMAQIAALRQARFYLQRQAAAAAVDVVVFHVLWLVYCGTAVDELQ